MKRVFVQKRTEENLWVLNNGTHSYLSGDGEVLSGGIIGPTFLVQPTNITKTVTDNVLFLADATGTPDAITYQWYFDSSKMVDKAEISGSTTKALSFTPALLKDAGSYFVVASNGNDATSQVVTLTLLARSYGSGQGSRFASNIGQVFHSDGTRVTGQLYDYN
jgi:hypothetical protein